MYKRKDEQRIRAGMVGLALKWVRLDPKLDNPGFFQIRFQYILTRCTLCQNLTWLTHHGADLPSQGFQFWHPIWVRLAPNGTNPGLFQIRFQYILARWAKMYWNLIWKNPGCFPFGANLIHFGAKSGTNALKWRLVILSVAKITRECQCRASLTGTKRRN